MPSARMRFLAIVVASVWADTAAPVLAYSTGMTGRSGKQSKTCTECHAGGAAPTVRLEQIDPPGTVAPGAIATFRFTVTSANAVEQVAAGLNVAASAGSFTVVANEGTKLLVGELTHSSPKSNTAGVASWSFQWTAPAGIGPQTLFAAGNSVDLSRDSLGDGVAATTLVVDVAPAATATATLTATATPTATPSATAAPATATATVVPPTATATASATPTDGSPVGCTGDCDASGEVTVDEVVTGVNIALGSLAIDECSPFDRDGDGTVTVDELVEGIQRALNGCPS